MSQMACRRNRDFSIITYYLALRFRPSGTPRAISCPVDEVRDRRRVTAEIRTNIKSTMTG